MGHSLKPFTLALLAAVAAGCAADTSDPGTGAPPLRYDAEPFTCIDPPGEEPRAQNGMEIFYCSPTAQFDAHQAMNCAKVETEAQFVCVVDPRAPDGTWYSFGTRVEPMTLADINGLRAHVLSYATGQFQARDCSEDTSPLLPKGWCP